jgi:glycosyltransferase involved in cell wall biosynthesis
LLQRARAHAAIPLGPWRLLAPWFARQIGRLVDAHRPDVLYVTSSPYYLLEVGVAAARAMGLPLCLDLRDPWSLNFNQAHKAGWVRRREARLERRFFAAADRVVLTCDEAAAAYRALYPELAADKLQRIYNGFDPAMRPAVSGPSDSGHIELVHFGNCYGPRKLATVLRGVAALRGRATAGADRVRVVNLGRPAQTDLDLAADLGLSDAFLWEPYLPYREGLARLATAHLQILLAYGEETLYVPAKTFDYLLTGAPVLALTQAPELRGIIESTGTGFVAGPSDVDGVADAIARALAAARAATPLVTPDATAVRGYAAPEITRQLCMLFDAMLR